MYLMFLHNNAILQKGNALGVQAVGKNTDRVNIPNLQYYFRVLGHIFAECIFLKKDKKNQLNNLLVFLTMDRFQ